MKNRIFNWFTIIILAVLPLVSISHASEVDEAWIRILLDSIVRVEKKAVSVEMNYENQCNDTTPSGMNNCRKNSQKIAREVAVEQGKDKLINYLSHEALKTLGYTSEQMTVNLITNMKGNPEFLDAGFVNKDDSLFYHCKIRINVTGKFSKILKKELQSKLNWKGYVSEPTKDKSPNSIILKLHGSNTIGSKLAPALAEAFLKNIGATRVVTQGGNKQLERTIDGTFGNIIKSIEIHAHGSSTGFEDMKNGKCDIAMASRRINTKEADFLSFLGNMTSLESEHVLALDGIALIVNKSNPIRSLSIEQLSSIFTGEIKKWSEIDNVMMGEIHLYARDNKSGTFDTFKHFILRKKKLGKARRYESNAELSDEVSKDPYGIGFTSLPFIRKSKAISVSNKETSPIFPNIFTVATEDYPLSRRLYFYSPSLPQNPYNRDFIEFALSYEGQEIVKYDDIGFISLNIVSFQSNIDPLMSVQNQNIFNKYLETVKNAQRLSLNFRFKTDSYDLDNKALRDMERMVEYLKKNKDKYDKIILIGFADSRGDYQNNYKLAMNRARRVNDELRSMGIYSYKIISASEEVPVASNETERGLAKNRRVEIWVK